MWLLHLWWDTSCFWSLNRQTGSAAASIVRQICLNICASNCYLLGANSCQELDPPLFSAMLTEAIWLASPLTDQLHFSSCVHSMLPLAQAVRFKKINLFGNVTLLLQYVIRFALHDSQYVQISSKKKSIKLNNNYGNYDCNKEIITILRCLVSSCFMISVKSWPGSNHG